MKYWMRTVDMVIVPVLILILFAAPLHARLQASTNYLLVEHPERLVVYNRYQQHITPEEQKLFMPFIPMKILDASAMLNDGFTSCMKIEFQARIFYLLKDDILEGAGKRALGFVRIVKNAVEVNDTVRLVSTKLMMFSPDKKKHHLLQSGKILVRYFCQRKQIFVKLTGQRTEYGWINVSEKKNGKEYIALRPDQNHEEDALLSEGMQKRIQSKFIEANKALKDLFAYFNHEAKAQKIVPQWRAISLECPYMYALEPEDYAGQFAESTNYLASDIDNILLGTNFTVVSHPGKIEINLK